MGMGSHVSDNDPSIIQQEKERDLQGRTPEFVPGVPGWNPNLASDSEAVVKAEQTPDLPMEQMQQQTIEVIQETYHQHAEVKVPCAGGHDPSAAPAIQENIEYTRQVRSDTPT